MRAFKNQKSRLTTNSREYKILTRNDDPYWEEGIHFHRPKGQRSGITRKWKKKELQKFQVRMYRSWKHNRITQWKEKKLKSMPSSE
jgi:hypothetical protein